MLLELDAVDEGSPKDRSVVPALMSVDMSYHRVVVFLCATFSLEVLRYNWCAINGGYTEGDTPSWQR